MVEADQVRNTSVHCLEQDVPYRSAARRFVEVASKVPSTPFGSAVATSICYEFFHVTEALLKGDEDPSAPFCELLDRCSQLVAAMSGHTNAWTQVQQSDFESVEEETGTHYGNLFKDFDAEHYYGEAARLLHSRLDRNGFDFEFAKGSRALDAGCGGGRYTVALKKQGFEEVVGLDYSEIGIGDAQRRLDASDIDGVEFQVGDVLNLPFSDGHFDFVFSNGVLHHTKSILRGLQELHRVLRPGGRGFLYLIESPGGIFWDSIELMRVLMQHVPYDVAAAHFAVMGVPPNRRFYILDHIMVPINTRSTPAELEATLEEAGFSGIVRLKRGCDFDRVEQVHTSVPYHDEKFGVGENRYFFSRPISS